jgi:ribosome maturation factor RimP
MALQLDTIRATADRIAASHSLDIVDLEFSGGVKFRTLRVFIEKNAEARAQLAAEASAAEASELPQNVPTAILSFTTHQDCELFTRDFGTVLDIEDLIPGAEYTLEVSSPGLERKLTRPADFTRFTGSLVKLQTFTKIGETRQFQARLTEFDGTTLTLDLSAIKPRGKPKKGATSAPATVQIAFANIEKANLIPEI